MHWYDAKGDGAVTSVGTRASDSKCSPPVAPPFPSRVHGLKSSPTHTPGLYQALPY